MAETSSKLARVAAQGGDAASDSNMSDSPASDSSTLDSPRVTARFHRDHVEIAVDGTLTRFEATPSTGPERAAASPRAQALLFLQRLSGAQLGRSIRVHTHDEDGRYTRLVITPDGEYFDDPADPTDPVDEAGPAVDLAAAADAESSEDREGRRVFDEDPDRPDDAARQGGGQDGGTAPPPATRRADPDGSGAAGAPAPTQETPTRHLARVERESFIRAGRSVEPATQGWRGALNKVGLRLSPGPAETEYRHDVEAVCRHWPGPRTIAVANPKGSASKTPTTVMLAAVFARYGGAGVLAWDNNETRGSLAWRTQQAGHAATVLDLLPRVEQLLATTAQSAEMSHWTHHQPADRYDVLHSDQSVEGEHEVSGGNVEAVHQVARRYYRMVLMDSGNNERAANWRAMMRRADALVVPCTNVEDTAEAGALMLEALASRDPHSEQLADHAVAIVSQRSPGRDANLGRIVDGLKPLVREVVVIPYDPALVSGVISFDALRPATQRAWLRAAAAVARGL